jgi:lipopolysaccharide transport system permease protein
MGQSGMTPIIVQPSRGWPKLELRQLWGYRDLLFYLAWRDVSVRYKQTLIGAAWAVVQPVCSMLVFSLFFGSLAGMPSDGVPYGVFCFAALLPWNYFAKAMSQAGVSLVSNSNLVTKIYFPRLVIPLASILPPLVDFAIAFIVLLGMVLWSGLPFTWNLLGLVPLLVLLVATALGMGLWLAALNVSYRDVGHIVPFLVQLGMFASPVVYPASLVPERWRLWYGLNPMTGVIEGFRWAVLGTGQVAASVLVLSSLVCMVLLASGLLYFQRAQKTFADVV